MLQSNANFCAFLVLARTHYLPSNMRHPKFDLLFKHIVITVHSISVSGMLRCMSKILFWSRLLLLLFLNNFSLLITFVEKGEVMSEHYKLLPVDLRDIPKLDDIISLANMDPRYACEVLIPDQHSPLLSRWWHWSFAFPLCFTKIDICDSTISGSFSFLHMCVVWWLCLSDVYDVLLFSADPYYLPMAYDKLRAYSGSSELFESDVVVSLPTFIIAECVLIYLDPDSSRAIVGWASKTFSTAIFFLYEQVCYCFFPRSSLC